MPSEVHTLQLWDTGDIKSLPSLGTLVMFSARLIGLFCCVVFGWSSRLFLSALCLRGFGVRCLTTLHTRPNYGVVCMQYSMDTSALSLAQLEIDCLLFRESHFTQVGKDSLHVLQSTYTSHTRIRSWSHTLTARGAICSR